MRRNTVTITTSLLAAGMMLVSACDNKKDAAKPDAAAPDHAAQPKAEQKAPLPPPAADDQHDAGAHGNDAADGGHDEADEADELADDEGAGDEE